MSLMSFCASEASVRIYGALRGAYSRAMMSGFVLLSIVAPVRARAQLQGEAPPRPITLQEAVQLAERNSPRSVQARGSVHTSVTAQRAAYAAFLPNVSVSATGNKSLNAGTTRINNQGELVQTPAAPWSYGTGLNANLNIFDGGRKFYEIRRSAAAVDAAEANQVLSRFNVALDVKRQYYAVLAARESEGAALAQRRQAEEQLKAATARIRAGAATKSDSLRSVIQVGNATLAVVTAQNDLRNANAALTRLVATPFVVTAAESDTIELLSVNVDSLVLAKLAVEGPAVEQAEAQLTVARAASRVARTTYFPSLDLTYSRSGSGLDSRFGTGPDFTPCASDPTLQCPTYSYNGQFQFRVSLPVFNQLSREEAIVGADVSQSNAYATLRDARLLAQQTLVQQLGALRTAEQRIAIQSASVNAAEEDLRVQQQRYALGASTLLDVLTSQTQLDQARSALIAARFDYRIAKAELEALVGRDL